MKVPLAPPQDPGFVASLLQSSIIHYEKMLALFIAINSESGNKNAETLEAWGTELLQLQEQAELADQLLMNALEETSPPASALPLLEKRLEIMHQVFTHNRALLSTANNIKSLLAHEIREMQGGRAALHGYRQTTSSHQGSILNASR
ncbi:MAG: hypothetical protein FD168_1885 [Desulfobulbaceae bacterium]|nr:MAG: hypothetical protein FD168_1885 [Desulfobulbaceae bacterium]